jgi:hypothetical protein
LINLPTLVWGFGKTRPRGWVDAQLQAGRIVKDLHALDQTHSALGQGVTLPWRT